MNAISSFPADWRNDLIRSMKRFILSQCRHQTIDRILDLALAFEIVLSSGDGSNAPLSWKISVRSAQLIGGPLPKRQDIRNRMTAFYNLRSKITHGSGSKSAEENKMEKVLLDTTSIYRDMLRQLLVLPDRPNWNSIELEPISAG
jgi:hypothetical protein